MDLPPLTSLPPADDRRFSYCYVGRRIRYGFMELWMADSLRSRPMLVLGSTGYGKTELLLSLAYSDAARGRTVIFLDGKCDILTRNKLHYYCHHVAGRPFYALMPFQQGDRDSDSWNPLVSATLPIATITEAFFNAYHDPGSPSGRGGEEYFFDMQRVVFGQLLRALHSSGLQFNTQDVRYLLDNEELLRDASKLLRGASGLQAYGDLIRTKNEIGARDWPKVMLRFLGHLASFDHWTLNSYNPSIQFDRLLNSGATIYVGLPMGSQPELMGSIGNLVLNQLKALSSHTQAQSVRRPTVSCIVDDGASFVDTGMAEWITKVRSSGFLLTLGIQTIASIEGRRPGFGDEMRSNAPNVFMFNPNDFETAQWFSRLSRSEPKTSYTASVRQGDLTEEGSARMVDTPRINPDSILALQPGQCFFSPPVLINRPPLLAAPYLPAPNPDHPLFRYRRNPRVQKAEFRGINLVPRIQQALRHEARRASDDR